MRNSYGEGLANHTILQAEGDKAVLRAAMEFGSRGTVQTITLPAVPIEEFVAEFEK